MGRKLINKVYNMANPDPRIPRMRELFAQSQNSKRNHPALINKMNDFHREMDVEVFSAAFNKILCVPLSIGEKNPRVENMLFFAASFAVRLHSFRAEEDEEEMCPFLKILFAFILKNTDTADPSLRYRIVYFLNLLLKLMGRDAFIDDEFCDEITRTMLIRILDKVPKIRAQAALTMHRLQEPKDPDCPIIKTFIFHMSRDPQPQVRRAVLSVVGKNKKILAAVMQRTRDVNDGVRKAAFHFVNGVTLKSFSIADRQKLLRDGLRDRSNRVRTTVETQLLPAWLDQCNGEYIKLLEALDAETALDTCNLALQALFKDTSVQGIVEQVPVDEDTKLIPIDKLSAENVVYWRCVIEHLQREKITEKLESILPDLIYYCEYVKSFAEMMRQGNWEPWKEDNFSFIFYELFEIAKTYDLGDEVGRQHLRDLILDTLKSEHQCERLMISIVIMLEKIVTNPEERFDMLAELINELRLPSPAAQVVQMSEEEDRGRAVKKAKLRLLQIQAQEEQYEAVKNRDFEKAGQLDKELRALNDQFNELATEPMAVEVAEEIAPKNDDKTLSRCLEINYAMMQGIEKTYPEFTNLFEEIVLPALNHPAFHVLTLAIKCTTNYCLKNEEAAKQNMPAFLLQFAHENEDVWLVTLKGVFDLLLEFGLKTFNMTPEMGNESETSNGSFINVLTGLLDHADQNLRTTATEGLCKLLLHRVIVSSSLISKLLILWNNPVTLDDFYLRQCLTLFFNNYPTLVPDSRQILAESFFKTLRILANAPDDSPLKEIKPLKIAQMILHFSRPKSNDGPLTYSGHDHLAVDILIETLKSESEIDPRDLIQSLKFLVLSLENESVVKSLQNAVEKLLAKINPTEKRMIISILAFKKRLYPASATQHIQVDEESDIEDENASDPEAEIEDDLFED